MALVWTEKSCVKSWYNYTKLKCVPFNVVVICVTAVRKADKGREWSTFPLSSHSLRSNHMTWFYVSLIYPRNNQSEWSWSLLFPLLLLPSPLFQGFLELLVSIACSSPHPFSVSSFQVLWNSLPCFPHLSQTSSYFLWKLFSNLLLCYNWTWE